jgi:3-oxoacyl-[acyl-carrier-protein] synthase II
VITGCGTINALGASTGSFWERLVRGASAIRTIGEPFPGVLAASVPDLAERSPASRSARLAVVAAREAAAEARLDENRDRDRIGVVVGTTTGGIREVEETLDRETLLGFEKAATADAVAAELRAFGPRLTVHAACASGATAILLAAALIEDGEAEVVVAGGSDALARITITGFRALCGAASRWGRGRGWS